MTVYFIGAGPGDPELITVKGQRLIRACPVILYAGSLVPRAVLEEAGANAEVIDTAHLHQDEIIEHIRLAHEKGLDVARVHSGDPSIYGAIGEQMRRLDGLGIPYQVIPGVTATSASAAALRIELTLPGISQTVIMTRYAGKTPMPEGEDLTSLAAHRATLAIHLGINRLHKIVEELIPFYGEDCPVAVLYRVSWPDQDQILGTLSDIVEKVREKKIARTALIVVGRVLAPEDFENSFLYREDKAHYYRPRQRKHDSAQPRRPVRKTG
jgi:precorrin-4/cobalt-precorrin-4 C11-methyltransferase